VKIAFSRSAGVNSIRGKQVSAQGRSRTSPVGTAECSPGRQSWVAITTRNSPGGTAENQSCANKMFVSWCEQHSRKTSQRSREIANQSRRDGRVSILSKLDFLDQQAWTAFAENKSALKADREPVP